MHGVVVVVDATIHIRRLAEKAVSVRVVLLVTPTLQCLFGRLLTRLLRLVARVLRKVVLLLREVALLLLGGFSCASLALRVRGVDLNDGDLLGAALSVDILLHDKGCDVGVRCGFLFQFFN